MKSKVSTAVNNDVGWQKNQCSGDNLIAIINGVNPDQVVPAHLNDNVCGRIETTSIQSVEIKSIRHCKDIPDYITPSSSSMPIVVANQGWWDCIEGWSFVEGAVGKVDEIECEVIERPEEFQSDVEVVLQKCSSRCATKAGTASYPELIRVTKYTMEYLLKTNSDLKQFTHGGRRKGLKFGVDRENDVLSLMANRMNLDRPVVQRYVDHGMYLDEATLELFTLSTKPKLTRDFFRNLQPMKTALVKQLKAEEKQDSEIVREVSALAIAEYDELKQQNNSNFEKAAEEQNEITKEENTEEMDSNSSITEAEDDDQSEAKTHVHHTPEDASGLPQPTFDSVKSEMIEMACSCGELAGELQHIDAAEILESKVIEHLEAWRELLTKLRATSTNDLS